jgi:nucleoside 2-deoxyribosyltransferase
MTSTRVYVASPLGFCASGRHFYREVLLPSLAAEGIEVLDPWAGGEAIVAALGIPDAAARRTALGDANRSVAAANVSMIEACDAVFAVLDGVDVDSGTASEIGFAAARGKPVVGWRSDLRLAGDNEAAVVNLQVEHFVAASGGRVEAALDAAVATLVAVLASRPA